MMKKKTNSLVLGLSTLLMAPGALAAGFQLHEFSAAAMGRANAGETAMADTAATIARNPAAMGNFDKAAISVVYHYIDPEIDVEGTSTNLFSNNTVAVKGKDVAPSASVPGLYYVQPINDQWAFGLSLNSHFGLSTEYGNDFSSSEIANETSIKTYYLTPNVSFKPVENLTLGLGISYIYGEGLIKNTASANTNPPVPAPAGTTLLKLDGDGDAFGYNLGLMWNINESTRLGLRYQSRVNLKLEGDMQKVGQPDKKGKMTVHLPEMYELGLAHDLNERVILLASVQKTGWHVFRELKGVAEGAVEFQKDEDWQDAWRYALGADFKVSDLLTLRAGYSYDESPVKEGKRHLSIPDASRNWYTLGASFNLGSAGSIDASFAYLDGGSAKVVERFSVDAPAPAPPGTEMGVTEFDGKLTSTKAYIYSIGYNISF